MAPESLLIALPILVPITTAALAMLTVRQLQLEAALGMIGALLHFASGIALFIGVLQSQVVVLHVGAWPAPFGISLVADTLSALLVMVTGLMGVVVTLYSRYEMDTRRVRYGYYPLLQILIAGVTGAFLTADLFNLYVWFEVMLISSFVLMVLGGERAQMEGAVKYVVINLFSSLIFLSGIGILYGTTGTLNFADLAVKLADTEAPGLVTANALLFAVAFGIKAALFPLFFWLPASYHTPPIPITTIFSGLLTKVGVYALLRVFTVVFPDDNGLFTWVFGVVAAFTMVCGVLGAVAQYEWRRLLSFHIISQIGYLIMGLAIGTVAGLAALIYFMVHIIIAKSALFLVSGIAHRLHGTYQLKQLGGLLDARPVLAFLFFLPAISMGGIPPTSGFFAKFAMVKAGIEAGYYWLVAAALFTGVLTLFSMMKIWTEAFWKDPPADAVALPYDQTPPGWRWSVYTATAVLSILSLVLGLAAEPVYMVAERAAVQLLDVAPYIEAVGVANR